MDRRRALLSGGAKELYIYEPGFTEWQNVAEVTTTFAKITFGADSVVVKSTGAAGTRVNLLINEATYKKYTKLIVKMDASGYSTAYCEIIWTNDPKSGTDEIELDVTKGIQEYSFDIAGDTGNRYLCFYPYMKEAVYTIYDVHFE